MRRAWFVPLAASLVLTSACGDSQAEGSTPSEASGAPGSETGAGQGDGDGDPTTEEGDGDPTTDEGDGDGEPTTDEGDGDGEPTTGEGDGDGEPDPSESDSDGTKFDLGAQPDGGAGNCDEGGEYEFSFLWVANSPEGTVSKIDTREELEIARYRTGAGAGNPSRTSVNLFGDMAVANRSSGTVVKIATREEDCVDANDNGMIDTSTGANDIRAWGSDECVLWETSLPNASPGNAGPRSLAWDTGDVIDGCATNTARLWVGYLDQGSNTGHMTRLDGQTGEILDDVEIPNWSDQSNYSPYGGAADADGNFWVLGKYPRSLSRADGGDLELTQYFIPNNTDAFGLYGMTLDGDGHPWAASWNPGKLFEFDTQSETWIERWHSSHSTFRGMAVDRLGYVWAAANGPCGLVQYDLENEEIVNDNVPLPGCGTPVGVSIDVDGFVWVVDQSRSWAYKVDPDTYESTTVTGLVSPYTYSDMTGAGLGLVANPAG